MLAKNLRARQRRAEKLSKAAEAHALQAHEQAQAAASKAAEATAALQAETEAIESSWQSRPGPPANPGPD